MSYDEDRDFELSARYDYISEAYGDACPGCGRNRFGGDCMRCVDDGQDDRLDVVVEAPAPVAELPVDWSNVDDDIVF